MRNNDNEALVNLTTTLTNLEVELASQVSKVRGFKSLRVTIWTYKNDGKMPRKQLSFEWAEW